MAKVTGAIAKIVVLMAVLVLVLVLAGLAFVPGALGDRVGSFLSGLMPFQNERVDRTGPPVLIRLTEISEFKAATGYYETVVDLEDDTSFVPSFISGRRVLYVGKGTVDATVDFSDLDERRIDVSEDGESVSVMLPAPTISDPVLDLETSYVADDDQGLVDRFRGSDLEQEAQLQAVDKMSTAAEGEGNLLGLAEDSTTDMLEGLLGALGYTEVEVAFEDA